ncbi:MAG: histidine kinase [Pirellulaceae bacterium]|nr:histidine kinase [Pirellulaceae bacterium]
MNGTHAMKDSEFAKSELGFGGRHPNDSQYQWLAHELHDGLLQWVVGARMQVESALTKLDKDSPAARNLDQAIAHMLNALAEGRSLIGFFENQEVGECDAIKEINNFVESVQSLVHDRGQSLRIELPHPTWPDLPKQHAWSLLRFVQQAVQNAIQHAGPTQIEVRLGWSAAGDGACLVASVEDQGVGFDPTLQAPEGHYGLQSLQQRSHMCGGRFELEAAPGHGCRVTLYVPV